MCQFFLIFYFIKVRLGGLLRGGQDFFVLFAGLLSRKLAFFLIFLFVARSATIFKESSFARRYLNFLRVACVKSRSFSNSKSAYF